eukprot:CAMPEP_0202962306 /NCGR_PEP_ID=MMETSP1396-20130829/6393_1 /ASSEMBLY_ACC=CAM_ASM_000872 /TAXON_ID= /ORGANISM="Pseudokeronopsis sp., Strain Brazil" /LENGTH=375 /DNA_ID=CAMNT_0049682769 /DNA_START=132 /DNA_END=1259 /DNA_ORIENTATION=-
MLRFNSVLSSTLKSRAIEETESVSKVIVRHLFQAVSNASNAESNSTEVNDSRSISQPYRPIVKSTSTPNLRSPTAAAQSSPRALTDPSGVDSPIALNSSPSVIQRRALSLQNLSISSDTVSSPSATQKKFFPLPSTALTNHLQQLHLEASSTNCVDDTRERSNSIFSESVEVEMTADMLMQAKSSASNVLALAEVSSIEFDENITSIEGASENNSPSANSAVEWCPEPPTPLDENVVAMTSPKALKRRVSFMPMASVILIPAKEEYYQAGINEDIWWRSWEMREFKQNAYREVQNIMDIYGISRVKEAFRRMSMDEDVYSMSEIFGAPANAAVTVVCKPTDSGTAYNSQQFGHPLHMSRSHTIENNLHVLAHSSS